MKLDFAYQAIAQMRMRRGLRQSDIGGLSERQVRRIEKGESLLTVAAARKVAESLGMTIEDFLQELSALSAAAMGQGADEGSQREDLAS